MRAYLLSFLVACSSSHASPDARPPDAMVETALGAACDATHVCGNGMICGTCGIATGQCTIACTAAGASGCPTGSYCSRAFTGASFDAHFCVKLCNADDDCHAVNAMTSCNDAYQDDGTSGPQICNVSNSIGSTHPCN